MKLLCSKNQKIGTNFHINLKSTIMIPYSHVGSKLIKAYNLYTDTEEARNYFSASFGDEKSFELLHYLVRYCNEHNQGDLLDLISPKEISQMSLDAKHPIIIEATNAYANGYIIKTGDSYELTHEFIVAAYMSCSNDNFIPLSTGHIDFSKTDDLESFLKDEAGIKEPQAVSFLVKLACYLGEKSGILMDRELSLYEVVKITKENDLIADLCLNWAMSRNMLGVDEDEKIAINGLAFSMYYSMPMLD